MKPALRLAVAAVVAQAPRLLIATAGIYGAPLSGSLRLWLAVASSIASATVLTGGCAYLAHAVAVADRNRGLLALFWGLTAVATVVILAPELVAAIPTTHLATVLESPSARWCFGITLAGFAEVVASGLAIAAASLDPQDANPRVRQPGIISLGYSDAAQVRAGEPAMRTAELRAQKRTCERCGKAYADSQQGAAAHARYCERREA